MAGWVRFLPVYGVRKEMLQASRVTRLIAGCSFDCVGGWMGPRSARVWRAQGDAAGKPCHRAGCCALAGVQSVHGDAAGKAERVCRMCYSCVSGCAWSCRCTERAWRCCGCAGAALLAWCTCWACEGTTACRSAASHRAACRMLLILAAGTTVLPISDWVWPPPLCCHPLHCRSFERTRWWWWWARRAAARRRR